MQCLRVKNNNRNTNSGYILVLVSIFLIGFTLMTSAPLVPYDIWSRETTTINDST